MENSNKLEIGTWVSCEDGIGQLMYIRELYVEPFVELMSYQETDKEGVYRKLYGIKLLCDFDGKLKKRHLLKFYTSISNAKEEYLKLINEIKENNSILYHKYIVFDQKDESEYVFTLEYFIDKDCTIDFEKLIDDVCYEVMPNFTFKEFKKEFKKQCSEIKLENFIKYGYATRYDGKKLVSIVFYARNYKVVNKERIFSGVRAFVK